MKRLATVNGLTQVLNSVANGITVQDTTGNLVFVNSAAARMLDISSPEEALMMGGLKIANLFNYFDEQGNELKLRDLPGRLALQGIVEPEKTVVYSRRGSTTLKWSVISARPVFDDSGNVIMVVNVIQDITPLKLEEHKIKATNERIVKILEEVLEKTTESANHPLRVKK